MSRCNRRVRAGRRAPSRAAEGEPAVVCGEMAAFPEAVMEHYVDQGFDIALCSCGDDLPGQVIGVFHPTRVKDGDTMPCPRCKQVLRFVMLTREESMRDHVLDGVSDEQNARELLDRRHPGAAHLAVLRGPNGERIEPKLNGMVRVN